MDSETEVIATPDYFFAPCHKAVLLETDKTVRDVINRYIERGTDIDNCNEKLAAAKAFQTKELARVAVLNEKKRKIAEQAKPFWQRWWEKL